MIAHWVTTVALIATVLFQTVEIADLGQRVKQIEDAWDRVEDVADRLERSAEVIEDIIERGVLNQQTTGDVEVNVGRMHQLDAAIEAISVSQNQADRIKALIESQENQLAESFDGM